MRRGRKSHQVQRGPQCRRGPGWWSPTWRDSRSVSSPAGCGTRWEGGWGESGGDGESWREWPRVVPLSTAGLNPMSTGLAGNRRDEGLAQSASSQHFRRDPTCQTHSKQVVDISQPIPPPCRVGAVAASLWRGHPGRGQIARTQSQQGACGQSSSGSGGRSWVSMWGEREGRGLGQTAEHEPVWGALDLGPPHAPGEGLGPGVPSPETLRESDSQGKSQGFRMLTVDSLFPKTQEG